MSRFKRFLSILMVMTIIISGIGLTPVASASGISGSAFSFVIFSGNLYPTQPSFSVRLQNVCNLTGSNIVNGSVHANYNINANTSTIIGVGEAVGTVTGDNIQTKIPGASYVPMPDFSMYKPQIKEEAIAAGQYYSGNFSIANATSVNLNSPVYVEGSANLSGISFSGSGCLYAGGKISISGSVTNYASGKICFYSGYTSASKSDAAIDFSGSTKNFTGLLYAPNGSILVTGSNYTFSGNIIGRVVDVSGSNKTFNSADVSESFKYACTYSITFNANGGTGGTSSSMAYGAALTAPTVTREGYTFNSWSPAVPATVPAADTTYTAQWTSEETDKVAVDINLEAGRYSGSVFTPLTPEEPLYTNDIITVRIVPTSDFLCGVTRYVVMFTKDYLQVVGNGNEAFTLNAANSFYQACSGLAGTASAAGLPESAWPEALKSVAAGGNGTYTTNTAIAVNNTSTISAPNGGYPLHLPGVDWLFSFQLKVTQDITIGSGAKVWMANDWLRKPGYTTGQMYFTKCLDSEKLTTDPISASSTKYNFNIDLSGADISLEPSANVNINFDANGGSGGTSSIILYGAALTAPAVAKTGYTLTGWSPAVPATVPAVDTTYTAQWTANQYIITFDANGGTGGTESSMDYGEAITAPTVTKAGYIFTGWSQAVPATVGAENATFTALWNLLGDLNSNGSITSVDALMVLQASSGKVSLSDNQKLFADVSKDGNVSPIDALKILQYISGKIISF